MDLAMDTAITGEKVVLESERTGVINETRNAMYFKVPSQCSLSCPLSKIRLKPYYEMKEKYAITVMMWFRIDWISVGQTCFLYHRNSLSIRVDSNGVISVPYMYSIKVKDTVKSDKVDLYKWIFLAFSFVGYTGEVKLEIDGKTGLNGAKKKYSKAVQLESLNRDSEIGKQCNAKIACLQVFNTGLTKQQKSLAKYRCTQDEGKAIRYTLSKKLCCFP